MKRTLSISRWTVKVAAFACAISTTFGSVIYDNRVNDLITRFDPGLSEVGDQIILAGTDRIPVIFSFEYWATNANLGSGGLEGTVLATVRFYANDGPDFNGYATPGTVLWTSVAFPVTATDRATLNYDALDLATSLPLPTSNMTWSVQFTFTDPDDYAGLDLYSPPVVGQNYPDYWQRIGGNWQLQTNVPAINFGAHLEAVPEPSSVLLLAVAGVLGLLPRWLRRK